MGNRFETERVAIKIGSNTIAPDGVFDREYAWNVAEQVKDVQEDRIYTILTISGANALGRRALGADAPQSEITRRGQTLLESGLQEVFGDAGLGAEFVLFVPGRMAEGDSRIRMALGRGRTPVSNGDDSAGSMLPDSLVVGNNDYLSARIAIKHRAHWLNLTMTDGVLDSPGGRTIKFITDIEQVPIFESTSPNGTGGMVTKPEAGLIVANNGLRAAIAAGRQPDVIRHFAMGEHVGTALQPRPGR